MNEKKTRCEELYKEYKDLVQKTNIPVQNLEAGKLSASTIPEPTDFLRKEEVRRELLDCRDFLSLSEDDWFEIENG